MVIAEAYIGNLLPNEVILIVLGFMEPIVIYYTLFTKGIKEKERLIIEESN